MVVIIAMTMHNPFNDIAVDRVANAIRVPLTHQLIAKNAGDSID
jgi:hypothetical protein